MSRPPDIPWTAFDDTAGNLFFQTPLGQAAVAVRDRLCNLWQNFPGFTQNLVGSIPRANILAPFLPSICDDRSPLIPLPAPPFTGGQCCGVSYSVEVSGVGGDGNPYTTTINVNGRVEGLVWEESQGNPELFNGGWLLLAGSSCPGTVPSRDFVVGGQNMVQLPTASIVSVSRQDGQLDSCGNPFPQFDNTIPPPDQLNFNIEVNVGGVNVEIPVSFNIGSPVIGLNFRPEINVQVGGINMILDFQGMTFNFNGTDITNAPVLPDPRPVADRPPPFQPTPAPPFPPGTGYPGTPGGGGGGGDCPDVNLQPVLNAIANVDADLALVADDVKLLLDCDRCLDPMPEECEKTLIGTGAAAKFQLDDRVVWVGVELIEKPAIPKGYLVTGSPDILICGWHEFGSSIASGVRTPIQYELNIFKRVIGASSFSFGLQLGYSANYFIYRKPNTEEA